MCMIGTEESLNEGTRTNAASIICEKNKSPPLKNASGCVHIKTGKLV